MKKPHPNKKDPRRERAAEYWRALTPARFETFLEADRLCRFTSASDVAQCFCMRVARDMGIEWLRVTFSPEYLYATDSRHNAPVFYVETPEFLVTFMREVNRTRPSVVDTGRRHTGETLLPVLRASLGLPPLRRIA